MRHLIFLFLSVVLLSAPVCRAQDTIICFAPVRTYDRVASMAPIQVTENGFGLAFAYEKFIDKSGLLSFNLPLMLTFNPSTETAFNHPRMDPMVYLQPGLKIYTNMNSSERGKISVGPNLVFASGIGRTSQIYELGGVSEPYRKRQRIMIGAEATIGANLFLSKCLYVGFDFSLGCAYINLYDGLNTGIIPLVQTACRIGLWK